MGVKAHYIHNLVHTLRLRVGGVGQGEGEESVYITNFRNLVSFDGSGYMMEF